MPPEFFRSMVELITRTATDLPADVRVAMRAAMGQEPAGTRGAQALAVIAENIDQAANCEGPICQDTGWPTFEVKTPVGLNQIELREEIRGAVAEATRRGKLRSNSVDSITGTNSGDNLGPGMPVIHFIIGRNHVRVVMGKGGMGARTLAGLKEHGAVYLNAIGGAAQFYARCIEAVEGVSLLDLGTPEAMWHLRVREFPAIVTMDAHGNSLHRDVEDASGRKLAVLRS